MTESTKMYCPKCSELLQNIDGELTCVSGDMALSKRMENDLYECFVSCSREPREREFEFVWGGTWFCPGCGDQMIEGAKGAVRCPSCQRNLAEFIYHLVELHPHKR
jgi:uncharacterized Zn finger protein (UPF0148 family)